MRFKGKYTSGEFIGKSVCALGQNEIIGCFTPEWQEIEWLEEIPTTTAVSAEAILDKHETSLTPGGNTYNRVISAMREFAAQ